MLPMMRNGSTGWFHDRDSGSLCAKAADAERRITARRLRTARLCIESWKHKSRTIRASMAVATLRSFDELQRLEPEWRDLLRRAPDATPFQSPEWLLPWWSHFGGQEMFAVTVRDGERLEALAPLYVLRDDESDESLGMLLGTGNSDYLDAVVASSAESLFNAIAEADCQLWDLQQLRPSSP